MYIELVGTEPVTVKLREPQNFRQFHVVEPTGLATCAVAAALAETGAGEPIGENHVFVNIGWLKAQVPEKGPEWDQGFESMLLYAKSKGWVNASETAIRAHMEAPLN